MFEQRAGQASERQVHADHWHRVRDLRPYLASAVRVHRQRYRSEPWYILEDRLRNSFVRLNAPAYAFVGLLDGKRSVEDACRLAYERFGDEAPTQGEVVVLLGQLHSGDLLRSEADAAFDSIAHRAQGRRRREVNAHLGGLLFVRIPLLNPDRLLEAMVPLARLFVSPLGGLLWLALIITGVWQLVGELPRLARASGEVLRDTNLLVLLLTVIAIKLMHECGHGLVLKVLARARGGAGVYRLGVMLLVFMPFPYIDVSGAWTLPSKWHRALVGMGGVLVEIAIGAIAMIVWAHTSEASLLNTIAFNAILATGVSTLLFNANPLMRYDGYHVLCDLIETPNLAQRSIQHLKTLIKRWCFGVRALPPTAHAPGERLLFLAYALASSIYRIVVYIAIALFILQQRFALGALLLVTASAVLIIAPLYKIVTYLLADHELNGRRARANVVTLSSIVLLFAPAVLIPYEEHIRVRGVVAPERLESIYAENDGVLQALAPSGQQWATDDAAIVMVVNDQLVRDAAVIQIELDRLRRERRAALRDDPRRVEELDGMLETLREQDVWLRERTTAATIDAPGAGRWIADPTVASSGRYVVSGDRLGLYASTGAGRILAWMTQDAYGRADRRAHAIARSVIPNVGRTRVRYLGESERSVTLEPTRSDRSVPVEFAIDTTEVFVVGETVEVRLRMGRRTLLSRGWDALTRVLQRASGP